MYESSPFLEHMMIDNIGRIGYYAVYSLLDLMLIDLEAYQIEQADNVSSTVGWWCAKCPV